MTDETKEVVSEESSAASTEQNQSADGAQESAQEPAAEEEPAKEEPAKNPVSLDSIEEAVNDGKNVTISPSGEVAVAPSLAERLDKIEADHQAFVKKLDDQYGIR